MKLVYKYNEALLRLNESPNGEDIEFNLFFHDQEIKKQLSAVKSFFDQNDIYTDLLVYTHSDKHIQMIVRKDYYPDFILQLFKQHLLEEVRWV
jgi:hypothetical protein